MMEFSYRTRTYWEYSLMDAIRHIADHSRRPERGLERRETP